MRRQKAIFLLSLKFWQYALAASCSKLESKSNLLEHIYYSAVKKIKQTELD